MMETAAASCEYPSRRAKLLSSWSFHNLELLQGDGQEKK